MQLIELQYNTLDLHVLNLASIVDLEPGLLIYFKQLAFWFIYVPIFPAFWPILNAGFPAKNLLPDTFLKSNNQKLFFSFPLYPLIFFIMVQLYLQKELQQLSAPGNKLLQRCKLKLLSAVIMLVACFGSQLAMAQVQVIVGTGTSSSTTASIFSTRSWRSSARGIG